MLNEQEKLNNFRVTQHHPLNFLAKINYEIKNDKVIRSYKNLRGESLFEIDISDIKRSWFYKTGDESWWNLAVGILFINIVFGWLWKYLELSSLLRFKLDLIFIIFFVLCVVMSFVKKKWIGFQNIYGQNIFAIQLTDDQDVKEFVEKISKRIKNK